MKRRLCLVTVAGFFLTTALAASGGAIPQSKSQSGHTAPESFRAYAQVTTADAGGGTYVTIQIAKYSPERDLQAMEQALKTGGSAAFLEALRKAPIVGHLTVAEQTFDIRWAREKRTPTGRVISIVTDKPVYFVGAGAPDAKPRAGFDLAVAQFTVSSAGIGQGVIAAAARVKPGGDTGVEIDDYASAPVKLVSLTRVIS